MCVRYINIKYNVTSVTLLKPAFDSAERNPFLRSFQVICLLLALLKNICKVSTHKICTIVSHNLFKPINPLAVAVISLIMMHWLTQPEYLSHIKMVID